MPLTPADALDAVVTVMSTQRPWEAERLDRISAALKPYQSPASYVPTVILPDDAPDTMVELARKSETNYLPLLVKTFSQVMKVDGYTSASVGTDPWVWWQRNRLDSRQTGLVRSALQYGAAYASALPGTYGRGEQGPSVSLFSPREMTALYQDPEADEWPMLAVAVDGQMVTLYDETSLYRFEFDPKPVPSLLALPASIMYGPSRLTFIDQADHDLGVTPVVRYRDRNLLSGEEQFGIVEPLLTVQERINETEFQKSVAQYFQAFKQRYIIGWVPNSEADALRASAAREWYFDDDPQNIKVDQLEAGEIDPYIKSADAAKRDFAALGQVPAQTLGVDGISNISDATLAGLEAAKNREASEIMTSLGESHEQLLRLCALIDGNEIAADDYTSEVRWRNFEARSFGTVVDGITKLAAVFGTPEDFLQDIPGMTGQRIDQIKRDMRTAQARATVAALSSAVRGNQG